MVDLTKTKPADRLKRLKDLIEKRKQEMEQAQKLVANFPQPAHRCQIKSKGSPPIDLMILEGFQDSRIPGFK